MFDFFVTALLSLLAVFPTFGSQGIQQLQQWRATEGRVELASSTAGLRIPSLASLDCIGTDGDGDFGEGTCTGGVGGSGFSTTSADYWKSVRNFFSTTSAAHFSALGLAFSTTSTDYWETQQDPRGESITAGDALTRTGDDIDFDGGATPGGELGGTWASPTIDDGVTVNNWALGTIASGIGTALTALNGENIQDDTIDDDSIDFADIEDDLESLLDIGGEVSSTGMSSTVIGDSIAVSSWNLTTPTFTTNFTFDSVTVTGLTGVDVSVVTGTAGTNGNCAEWNADGDLVDAGDPCGTGAGGGGDGTWSTTTSQTSGVLINYPNNDDDVVTIGSNSTTTAEWWFDPSLLSMNVGTGGAGDSTLTFGPNTSNQWMMGWDDTDKSFAIASSTALGTTNVLTITKSLLATFAGALTATGNLTASANFIFDGQTFDSFTDDATLSNNSGDLRVVDVTCTDCLNATEIEDIYLLDDGDTGTGNYTFSSGLFTTTNASSSLFSTGYASSTLYYGAGLADCHTGNMLTWQSGQFGCEDDTEGEAGGGMTTYDAWTHPQAGTSATTSGMIITASSTIGNGTQAGGLLISGGATTTGNAWFSDIVRIGNGVIDSVTGGITISGSAGGAFNVTDQVYTGAIDIAGLLTSSSGVNLGGATFLEIPNGTAPTANDVGELAHDTTDNMLILDDFVVATAVQKIWSTTVASTSPIFIAGSTLSVPTELDGYTITAIRCKVDGGTSKVIAVEDASGNSSEDITCATTVTSDDGSITNATATAAEEMYIDFGATTGAVDTVSISVFGTWTRE